jgi:hypothetical protein
VPSWPCRPCRRRAAEWEPPSTHLARSYARLALLAGRPRAADQGAALDGSGAAPYPPGPAGRSTARSGSWSRTRRLWRGAVPSWPCRSADRVQRTREPPSKHLARSCARLALSALQAACSGLGATLDAPGAALCPPGPAGRAGRGDPARRHTRPPAPAGRGAPARPPAPLVDNNFPQGLTFPRFCHIYTFVNLGQKAG